MEIGYYRYKISDLPTGEHDFVFYNNGNVVCTHKAIIKDFCTDFKIVKYLDSLGRYRFFPFNSNWEKRTTVSQIGERSKIVTSILTSQSDRENIGYKTQSILSLVAENVTAHELEVLSEIYASPRVYLHNGTGDDAKDWLKVIVSGDGVNRRRKDLFGKVTINLELPTGYAITEI